MVYFTASVLMMLIIVNQILGAPGCEIEPNAVVVFCINKGLTTVQHISGNRTGVKEL